MRPIIITYHSLSGPLFAIFKQHLDLIMLKNWDIWSLDKLYEYRLKPYRLKTPAFVLTFDDGYVDVYEKVFPLSRDLNFSFVVFVPTDYIGKENSWNFKAAETLKHLSAEQIKEMADCGVDIGSHTCSHVNLLKLEEQALELELKNSKKYLEKLICKDVGSLAYPYGASNARVQSAVGRHYKMAFCNDYSIKKNYNILSMSRIDASYLNTSLKFRAFIFLNRVF